MEVWKKNAYKFHSAGNNKTAQEAYILHDLAIISNQTIQIQIRKSLSCHPNIFLLDLYK